MWNKITLLGRLGKDPESKSTSNGKFVVTFPVATTRKRGESEATCWHNVVAWDRLGETCARYLAKGRTVLVDGELVQREYVDKSGQNRRVFDVVASTVRFVGDPNGSATQNQNAQYGQSWGQPGGSQRSGSQQQTGFPQNNVDTGFDGDDIPF